MIWIFTFAVDQILNALTSIKNISIIVKSLTMNNLTVNNLTITINNKYISKQYLDNTSSSSRMIKPYSVADLIVNYSLKLKNIKELSFSINLNNIFNTKYVSSGWTYSYFISNTRINDNWFYPQAGFNILSGITLKF